MLQERPIMLGVLITVMALFAVDALMSRSVIAPTKIGMVVLRSRAASLDGLGYRAVAIEGSFEGLEIGSGAFRRGDVLHITGPTHELPFALTDPGNARFVPYNIRHSTLGFVLATKAFVQVLPTRVSVIGPAHDGELEAKASSRQAELERLRDYVPGDKPNRVNWMASAKTGQLRVLDDGWQQDEMVIVIEIEESSAGDSSKIRFVTGVARLAIEQGWNAGLLVRVVSMHDTDDLLLAIAEDMAGKVDSVLRPSADRTVTSSYLRDDYVNDESDMVERLAGIAPGSIPRPLGVHHLVSEQGLWLAE